MSQTSAIPLGTTLTFDVVTHRGDTGASANADSTPTAAVFEDTNDTSILSPTVTARAALTGDYRLQVACTIANGFEIGKSYNVVVTATINGVTAKAVLATFVIGSPIYMTVVVADGSNTATTFKTSLTETTNDHWKDALLTFTSGALAGQVKKITAYDGTTKFVTFTSGYTGAPSGGDTFDIVNE